jgi:ankyrin repeat protein
MLSNSLHYSRIEYYDLFPEVARALIKAGVNINGTDVFGNTSLHYAHSPEAVQVLLDAHANPAISPNTHPFKFFCPVHDC